MTAGYTGKILIVDLTSEEVKEEQLHDELYREFIGGVGLGVRLLYKRQPGKVAPLGQQNILGFMPELLTGTAVPSSSRLTLVSKSPFTGGWGDANVGGYIGYELKRAGYDGILFHGISPQPVYLLIHQGKAELRDASHLWGKDTIETEEMLRKETKVKFIDTLKSMGTAGSTEGFIVGGATPIKNWSLSGEDSMPPDTQPYGTGINSYLVRRSTCAGCPIGCGGSVKTEETGECLRPECETIVGFGPMCLNNDMVSIIEASAICDRYGIDTISVSTTIAFTIECYQRGIITKQDTDGIELTWNNPSAVIAMLKKIVKREGFGTILADGVKRAAEKIGHGAWECAIHVGGQELGFHDPRQLPARGTGYICDPTPGRHTTFFAGTILERAGSPGPYPELWEPQVELRDYEHKSAIYSAAIKYEQVVASAGVCKFAMFQGTFPVVDFIIAVTGWDFSPAETLVTGERIQTLRQLFNIREGINPKEFCLPQRVSQSATTGPFRGIPVDFDLLRKQYYEAMGWDPETGYPVESRLEELGLRDLANSG